MGGVVSGYWVNFDRGNMNVLAVTDFSGVIDGAVVGIGKGSSRHFNDLLDSRSFADRKYARFGDCSRHLNLNYHRCGGEVWVRCRSQNSGGGVRCWDGGRQGDSNANSKPEDGDRSPYYQSLVCHCRK